MGLSVGKDRAAFAGGDLLVGIEAEDGQIAEAADAAPVEFGTNCFACVFDDGQIVSLGEIAESIACRRGRRRCERPGWRGCAA